MIGETGGEDEGAIVLHGSQKDASRVRDLAARLNALGHPCDVALWRAGARYPEWSRARSADTPDGDLALFCWTRTSIGSPFLIAAAAAKVAAGRYLGVILDDVAAPAEVARAQEVSLTGRRADAADLAPLTERLTRRADDRKDGGFRRVMAVLVAIADHLRKFRDLMKALGVAAVVGFLFLAFNQVIGFEDTATKLCRFEGAWGFCRSFPSGVLKPFAPTQTQVAEWEAISRGADCEAFETYIGRYGSRSYKVEDARLRLTLVQHPLRPFRIALEEPMRSWDSPPLSTKAAAENAVRERASAQALSRCAEVATLYQGQAAPGVFTQRSEPDCAATRGGFRCEWRGDIVCTVLRNDLARTCPLPPGSPAS